jgi:chlorinating enzyme
MPKILTQAQAEGYKQDGYACPVRVMSGEETAGFRKRFEAYELEHGGWYELSKGQKLYLLQTWAADLVRHPKVLDAVEDVLGPDFLCWGQSLFVKDAHDPGFVTMHQDGTYWGLSKPDVVTAWIALSPSTEQSGCMKVVPGTHKMELQEHTDTLDENNLLTRGQEIAVDVDEGDTVFMPLQPGELSLHHVRLVHGSAPNQSDDRRIGVAVRYIAPHVKQDLADKDSAWLVRGEDKYGYFVHETPPNADMDEAAMAEHERIMKLRQGVLYKGVTDKPAHIDLPDGM